MWPGGVQGVSEATLSLSSKLGFKKMQRFRSPDIVGSPLSCKMTTVVFNLHTSQATLLLFCPSVRPGGFHGVSEAPLAFQQSWLQTNATLSISRLRGFTTLMQNGYFVTNVHTSQAKVTTFLAQYAPGGYHRVA